MYIRMKHFHDNRTFVADQDYNIKLLDIEGNAIDISQHNITDYKDFHEGLAGVKIGELWGYMDVDGNLLIKPQFMAAGFFSAGLAWVRVAEGKVGYINTKGEIAIDPIYIKCFNFDKKSGRAKVKKADKWFYINSDGEELFTDAYRFYDFSDGCLRTDQASISGTFGYKVKDGKWIIEPQYDVCKDFQSHWF